MKSTALRESAKHQECTFNIVGVCNYDPTTVVLCHLPDESHGIGRKSDDICAAFGCSSCHAAVDGRSHCPEYTENQFFYNHRANLRTIKNWINAGLIEVRGYK